VNASLEAAGTPFRRLTCALGVLASLLSASSWAGEAPPAPRAAEPAPLAAHSLLIAIAAAGPRLVAVGDRGVIVLSDDEGASWTQAAAVPTQALLTGVCFLDAQRGVAVGHDEVALATVDAGRTWRLTHYAPEAERPLLDVWCGASGQVIAIGAYSTYLTSGDGGGSWSDVRFTPAPPAAAAAPARVRARGGGTGAAAASSAAQEEAATGGYHLNRIVAAGGGRLYIAGEAGHLYRSDDNGTSWVTLPSPYEGSFFGVQPLDGGAPGAAVLAFGLRGNLYRSEDAGLSWQRIETGTVAMLDGAARLRKGVAIVGLAGVVLLSRDGARSFQLLQQADHSGLSAAVAVDDVRLAVVGENGARVINLDATPAAGGSTP
jgi:photosystem II stability/assembly factor-like uncharacterized protein